MLSPSTLSLPVLVKLVFDVVLHGVRLVVDELPGVAGDVVFEHVLAVHGLQLHSGDSFKIRISKKVQENISEKITKLERGKST